VKFLDGPANIIQKEYKIRNFNSLKIEGFWRLKIIKGKSFSLSLKAPQNMLNYVNIDISQKTLILKQDYFSTNVFSNIELLVSMPSLRHIYIKGINNIEFSGFKEDQLAIEASGFTEIESKNSYIENIKFTGSGVIGYELGASTVVNAFFSLKGLGTINLNMAGGNLEGRISKNINIDYKGEVNLKNINFFEKDK